MNRRPRIIVSLIAAVLMAALLAVSAYADDESTITGSGQFGDNLTWTIDNNGVLNVEGTGTIPDYSYFGESPVYQYCSSIKEIRLAEGVTGIGSNTFSFCSSVTSISFPDSLKHVNSMAFQKCTALESVNIPAGTESIDTLAFLGCSALREISVSENNTHYTADDNVLFTADKKVLLLYPVGRVADDYTIPDGITKIGNNAFQSSQLKSIDFPDGLQKIEREAFNNCPKLESVSLPDSVTTLGTRAFSGCSGLQSVKLSGSLNKISSFAFSEAGSQSYPIHLTIPDGITCIGDHAFYNSKGISRVQLPDSITEIAADAFSSSYLSSINLPASLVTLSPTAFDLCTKLKTITSSADSKSYVAADNVVFSADMTQLVLYPAGLTASSYVVPNGVEQIVKVSNSSLTSVTFSEGVKTIGESAFQCSSLKTVVLPAGLETVGSQAFYNCNALEFIDIPESVKDLKQSTFYFNTRGIRRIIIRNPRCSLMSGFVSCKANRTDPSDIYIYGFNNSTAPDYAEAHSHVFRGLEELPVITLSQDQFVYDGTEKAPEVSVNISGETLDPSCYTVSGASNTNAGKYTIVVDYKDPFEIYEGTCTSVYTIVPASVTPEVVLSNASITYNGTAQAPSVTVKVGDTVLDPAEYTLSDTSRNIEAGEYRITAALKGNYEGEGSAVYTITPSDEDPGEVTPGGANSGGNGAPVKEESQQTGSAKDKTGKKTSDKTKTTLTNKNGTKAAKVTPTVILSKKVLTYNGKAQAPKVTVKVKGKKISSSYYTVKNLKRTLPGKYKVAVRLRGKYKGSGSAVYRIKLRKTNISRAEALKGQFYIRWKKATGARKKLIDGYQVQYSSSKKFKTKISRTSKNPSSKEYYSLDDLKSNKTYCIRIRTFKKINRKTYYSPWSDIKKVRIK